MALTFGAEAKPSKLDQIINARNAKAEKPLPRAGQIDDLTFLPANLTRLVIDPYREACRIDTELGSGRLAMAGPFLATGFDDVPDQVRRAVAKGLHTAGCP